ncbi:MAG: DAK2 domain-containing protein [Chloroflexota bacterium]|nr:DAK2 domain-containing protein [Chloroflexota bacterium]
MYIFTGASFGSAIKNGATALAFYKDHINRINVFPVPDGDTGSNMLATLTAGLPINGEVPNIAHAHLGLTLRNIADGCFWGARGNSGVLLSQFILGMARYLDNYESCDTTDMLHALESGTRSAYQSMTTPTEGTMLTVMSRISTTFNQQVTPSKDPAKFWEAIFYEAQEALQDTTAQLEVLLQSGVVDSGAFGLLVIISGIWASYSDTLFQNIDLGHIPDRPILRTSADHQTSTVTDTNKHWGFCTQLVVSEITAGVLDIRAQLSDMSGSVITTQNGSSLRIHVHTTEPAAVLEYLREQGAVTSINIQNMDHQVYYPPVESEPNQEVALLAVTQDNFDYIFEESGCTHTISISQGDTLTANDILQTIQNSISDELIIIANNISYDAILKIFDKASINNKTLHVLSSHSLIHGLAAAIAFNPFASVDHNLLSMSEAISNTLSFAINQNPETEYSKNPKSSEAAFILTLDGVQIDYDINLDSLLQRAIEAHSTNNSPLLTLFRGKYVSPEESSQLATTLESRLPNLSVELLSGGQIESPYLVSLE